MVSISKMIQGDVSRAEFFSENSKANAFGEIFNRLSFILENDPVQTYSDPLVAANFNVSSGLLVTFSDLSVTFPCLYLPDPLPELHNTSTLYSLLNIYRKLSPSQLRILFPKMCSMDLASNPPLNIPFDIAYNRTTDISLNISIDIPVNAPSNIPNNVPFNVSQYIPIYVPSDVPLNVPIYYPIDVAIDVPYNIPEYLSGDVTINVSLDLIMPPIQWAGVWLVWAWLCAWLLWKLTKSRKGSLYFTSSWGIAWVLSSYLYYLYWL